MKKIALSLVALTCLLLVGCDDKPIAPAELPQEIQTFVQQTFPSQSITFAMKDWGLFGSEYDLTLNDGTTISFDSNKTWDKVNSPVAPVPASLVPAPITTYLNTNFAGVALMKIEKERYGYEVKLANGLEMKFNQQGALREIDD